MLSFILSIFLLHAHTVPATGRHGSGDGVGASGSPSLSPSFLFLSSAPSAWAHRRQLSNIIQEPICHD